MVSRRAYRRVSVNEIDRQQLLELTKEHGNAGAVLGLDIAGDEIVACQRRDQDHCERPWKIINPKEIGFGGTLRTLEKSLHGIQHRSGINRHVWRRCSRCVVGIRHQCAACQWQSGVGLP